MFFSQTGIRPTTFNKAKSELDDMPTPRVASNSVVRPRGPALTALEKRLSPKAACFVPLKTSPSAGEVPFPSSWKPEAGWQQQLLPCQPPGQIFEVVLIEARSMEEIFARCVLYEPFFETLSEAMNEQYSKPGAENEFRCSKFVEGDLCAVCQEGKWLRARLIAPPTLVKRVARVHFVDMGWKETVRTEHIRLLHPDFIVNHPWVYSVELCLKIPRNFTGNRAEAEQKFVKAVTDLTEAVVVDLCVDSNKEFERAGELGEKYVMQMYRRGPDGFLNYMDLFTSQMENGQ